MKKVEKRVTMNDLADMVKVGFDQVYSDMHKGFNQVYSDMESGFSTVRAEMKHGFDRVDHELSSLRTDVSGILLRLTGVADRVDVIKLEKRVDRLEQKTGIGQQS